MSVNYNKVLKVQLKKVQEHADALYKLVSQSCPDGNMFRGETEQDKRIGQAVWHAHEVSKYLSAALYNIEKRDE